MPLIMKLTSKPSFAFPFISPLMVLLAIPFALKRQMSGSVSLSFGIAMVIGFGYWVLAAFCVSLGHSGAIPPWLSAWVPNGIFALIGLFFFTAEEVRRIRSRYNRYFKRSLRHRTALEL